MSVCYYRGIYAFPIETPVASGIVQLQISELKAKKMVTTNIFSRLHLVLPDGCHVYERGS